MRFRLYLERRDTGGNPHSRIEEEMEGEAKETARPVQLSAKPQQMVRDRLCSVCVKSYGAVFAGTDLHWYRLPS